MSARQFDYFDDLWKTEVLECPQCHWLGRFDQGSVEHYTDQMDCACPKCDVSQSPILAVVLYPTLSELRANIGRPGVREWVERIDRGFDQFEAQKLRGPSQLPDIGESSFELAWDFDDSNPNDPRTVIRHGDVVIFSESARYECFKRFGEVTEILREKYGACITDLVPTLRSEGWLYGNATEAKNFVEWFRLHHFGVSVVKQWQLRSDTESFVRNLTFLEIANQQTARTESQPQLALNFDTGSGPSHEQKAREDVSEAPAARRPVPGVPGASWERDEFGTTLILEPNAEFDSLPQAERDDILDRMLNCMEAPHHIQRVTALRDEFASGLAQKTRRPPDDCPAAYSHFHYGPELPEITAETFTFVCDYSEDVSRYFVLHGETVVLSGLAAPLDSFFSTDRNIGDQFIEIAKKLKMRYGAKLLDLVPTQKAESLLTDVWGWSLKTEYGRKIARKGVDVSQF